MPEFLQKRFQSQWIRTYLTAVALISYVFTKTSVRHFFVVCMNRLCTNHPSASLGGACSLCLQSRWGHSPSKDKLIFTPGLKKDCV